MLHQDATLSEAARSMREKGQGCVFVSDHQGYVVGVVTDRDLSCRALAEQFSSDAKIVQVMTPSPVCVGPFATLDEVVRLMEENGIRRVPVFDTDAHGRSQVVGLVTLDDLVSAEMLDTFRLSRIVRAQVQRRTGEFRHQRGMVTPFIDSQGRVVSDDEVLSRFFFELHLRSGAERMGLSLQQSEGIAREFLRTLISRLHYTGARHVLAHLPPSLEDEWGDEANGPQRQASMDRLLGRVREDGFCVAENCREAVMAIGRAWSSLIPEEELHALRAQLPPEFNEALLPAEDFERREWARAA